MMDWHQEMLNICRLMVAEADMQTMEAEEVDTQIEDNFEHMTAP